MTFFQSTEVTSMIVALISLAGVFYTAWTVMRTKRETGQINKSVNHVKPDEKRLYELAVESSLCLTQLVSRLNGVEKKLDDHILFDRRCPLLDDCKELIP